MYEPTHYLDKRQIYSQSNVEMYQAYDAKFNRKVILKQIKYENKHMLVHMKKDALILTRATDNAKNVTKIYDYYQDMDSFTMVMQYVDNALKLDSWLRSNPSLKGKLKIFIAVCEAIDNMHKKHITHKRLDPTKIQITNCGHVYISEFSLSGEKLGKSDFSYFRPAIDSSFVKNEKAIDLFSLGTLLYFMVSGEVPVLGVEYEFDIMNDIKSCEVIWLKTDLGLAPSLETKLIQIIKMLMNGISRYRNQELMTVIELTKHIDV